MPARIAAITLAVLLAGCISAEERAARDSAMAVQAEAEQAARNRAYTDHLTSQCAAIGYQHGTDGMRQCILQLHSSNQANDGQMRAVIMQQLLQPQPRALPRCTSLPPGQRGYMYAQGSCR